MEACCSMMHNDQSELLKSSNPLITSIVTNSFLLGMPLTDDQEVLDQYADFHAELDIANEQIEDELEVEQDDRKSLKDFAVDLITNKFFPRVMKGLGSLFYSHFQIADLWLKAKHTAKLFLTAAAITGRIAYIVITSLVRAIFNGFKHVLKIMLRSPYGWATLGLTAVGITIYKFFIQKKVPENLKNKHSDLFDFDIDRTLQLMYPEWYGQPSDVEDVTVTQEEYDALTKFRASDEDIFTPETEILHTMKTEGWDNIFSNGREYSKFGIRANDYRPISFIRDLTGKQAYDIYKREYWDAAHVESVPEEMQRIYFNTAVNMGVGAAKELYRESGGTLEGFVRARNARYRRIAYNDSFNMKYLKGWLKRSRDEYQESIKAIKNVDAFRKQQMKENQDLIRCGKVIGAV